MFNNIQQNLITQDAENKVTGVYVPAKYLMLISKGRKTNNDAVDDGKHNLFTGGEYCLKTNSAPYDYESIIISNFRCIDKLNMHYVCGESFDATTHAIIHHNFDSHKIIPKFFYYFAKANFSNYARELGVPVTTVFTATSSVFQNFPVWTPSLEKQRKIVDFLDREMPVLKKMKEKLHKLDEELTRYKTSISAKAENFDNLIKKACKTDETISYEKIPAKYLMLTSLGQKTKADAVDNGKYILFTGGKKNLKIDECRYDCESVVISIFGCIENLTIHHVFDQKFNSTKAAVIHHSFDETKIIPKFFYYFAKANFSNYARELGIPMTTIFAANSENFQNFPVWTPSLEQQRKIIDFLDQKEQERIEKIVILNNCQDKVKKAIELLKRYERFIVSW